MSRFESTGPVDLKTIEHSVVSLPWGVIPGALGPSDGSVGSRSNVPSALAVLRHAQLYSGCPEEIEEAFQVLEHHVMDGITVYPVAVTVLPFLFDTVRRGSPIGRRIAGLIARYARHAVSLEVPLHERLHQIVVDHEADIASWFGRYDRAAAALAIHIPELRGAYVEIVSRATQLATCHLLALAEIGEAPGGTRRLALRLIDRGESEAVRMVAAAFLARFGEHPPELATRLDAALPPSARGALARYVDELWLPTIQRPPVAPKLCAAKVVFVGEKLVLARAGVHNVTLPWQGAPIERGQTINVGITVHGQPRLAIVERDGNVTIKHF
jgi:hypothetical protein